MLLHAFAARAGAGDILRDAAGQDAQPGEVALLSAVSMCFALGAATTEQFKHLAAAEAGPLAGLARSCRGCGRCGRRWPRSPTEPTR